MEEKGILPKSFSDARIKLIPKPDKGISKKEHNKPIHFMNTDTIILNKILANQVKQHINNITPHEQMGFIPEMLGWLNTCIPIIVICCIFRMKSKNYIAITIDSEKAFHTIKNSSMIKTCNKIGIEGIMV